MFLRKFCEHCPSFAIDVEAVRVILKVLWTTRYFFIKVPDFWFQSDRSYFELISIEVPTYIFCRKEKTARSVFGTLSNIWNVLRKVLSTFSRKLFSLNFSSYMFVRVLNTPLTVGLVVLPIVWYYRNYASTLHVSCL